MEQIEKLRSFLNSYYIKNNNIFLFFEWISEQEQYIVISAPVNTRRQLTLQYKELLLTFDNLSPLTEHHI